MIHVDVLLSEEQIAEEFFAALSARYLPEKFFYWLPLSVKAWLDLCRGAEYKNFARSLRLVSSHAEQVAQQIPRAAFSVISLGAGQGDKDLLLLEALRQAGHAVSYRPVDSSQALLERACAGATQAGFPARGLKADLVNRGHVSQMNADAKRSRLLLLLGNTLGGFGPLEFVSILREIVRPGDWLLLDGEIFSGNETMAGYDNPINRRFAFAPLRSIGIGEEDGALRFESLADSRREGLYLVGKYFVVGRRRELVVAGKPLWLERDEKVSMSSSYKYTRAAFLEIVRQDVGLEVVGEYVSEGERFLMVLARRSPGAENGGGERQNH